MPNQPPNNLRPDTPTGFLYHLVATTFFRDDVTTRFEHIKGYLHPDEGYTLFLGAMHGPGRGAIVEIGSFMGRSTCFLAAGAKMAGREKVYAIDHFSGSPEHQTDGFDTVKEIAESGTTFPQFQKNIADAGLTDQVEPIRASTVDAARGWDRPIRLLFLDGDHSYEATRRDFELFAPHVVPDGIVMFHDTVKWPDVQRFCVDDLPTLGWQYLFRVQSMAAFTRRR